MKKGVVGWVVVIDGETAATRAGQKQDDQAVRARPGDRRHQPVPRVWGIRSVTRPAVIWDVIELQPAHQNQSGHPELPKSVERAGGSGSYSATSSQPR
jgi:hypothetical protein